MSEFKNDNEIDALSEQQSVPPRELPDKVLADQIRNEQDADTGFNESEAASVACSEQQNVQEKKENADASDIKEKYDDDDGLSDESKEDSEESPISPDFQQTSVEDSGQFTMEFSNNEVENQYWIQCFMLMLTMFTIFGFPEQRTVAETKKMEISGCTGVRCSPEFLDEFEPLSAGMQQMCEEDKKVVTKQRPPKKKNNNNIRIRKTSKRKRKPHSRHSSGPTPFENPFRIPIQETVHQQCGPQPIESPQAYGIQETGLHNPRGGGRVEPIEEDPPYGIQEENFDADAESEFSS